MFRTSMYQWIKIEEKIVNKRYYLDFLNEGSQRGALGQGDGSELVCGSLGGVLALLSTMSEGVPD